MLVRLRVLAPSLLTAILLAPTAAHAGGGGASMPWDGPLQSLINNLTGPLAKTLAIAAIVIAGLIMAFSELSEGAKRLVQGVLGVSVAIFAAQVLASLGLSGALL